MDAATPKEGAKMSADEKKNRTSSKKGVGAEENNAAVERAAGR